MHFNRMRTARLLTVSRSIRGGVCLGVSAQGGYPPEGGRGSALLHTGIHPPPVNRITDRCKNITLPQTLFAGRKNPLPNNE